jgi:hypothetical protein
MRLLKPVQGSTTGKSEKQHLLDVWKATGRMPDGLAKWVDKPQEVMYLWNWLCEMAFPLSFSELEAWMRVTGRSLTKVEITAIAELDRVRAK